MRDAVRSDDDVAVEAAKEKLASLTTRPGFEEAMHPRGSGSARARWIAFGIAVAFAALAILSFQHVDTAWLSWVLALLFSGMSVLSALAGIGFGPEPAPNAMGAVVLGKRVETKDEHPFHYVELLRADGTRSETIALDSIHAMLKVGDVGVAHVKPGTHPIVVGFHRL